MERDGRAHPVYCRTFVERLAHRPDRLLPSPAGYASAYPQYKTRASLMWDMLKHNLRARFLLTLRQQRLAASVLGHGVYVEPQEPCLAHLEYAEA